MGGWGNLALIVNLSLSLYGGSLVSTVTPPGTALRLLLLLLVLATVNVVQEVVQVGFTES